MSRFRLPCRLIVCLGQMWRAGWVIAWLVVFACLPAQAAQSVTLLLSESTGIYQEAAQALQRELTSQDVPGGIQLRTVAEQPDLTGDTDGLIVTLGVRALNYAIDAPGSRPLFALLVPNLTFARIIADHPQARRRQTISALILDQPYTRQLQLIRHALPSARRVGVLVGPATASQAEELTKTARETGLEAHIHAVNSREQVFSGFNQLAREVDVLLLLPDPQVVSGETLRALFLQAYRQRLPVVAYASSLVQAGATLGLYATTAQMGSEAGRWIRDMLAGREASKGAGKVMTRFPQLYTVEINRNVARTLELSLPSVESLNARLNAERKR